MSSFFLLLCFKSCLKGNDNQEYYKTLNVDVRCDQDEIRKAFRKISLNLHPDKLAQRGQSVTAEISQQFLKAKEAYDVLSDAKRRKLYDALGASGMKFIENPSESNPLDLIKNFQNNRADRSFVGLSLFLLFVWILLIPILLCLKCDGTLGKDSPWSAIWTPMWILDMFLIVISILVFFDEDEGDDEDSNDADHDEFQEGDEEESSKKNKTKKKPAISLVEKVVSLVTTLLFVLIQIFVMIRLDGYTDWDWFAVFSPWFLYELTLLLSLLPSAFLTPIPIPPSLASSPPGSDAEEGRSDEFKMKRLFAENQYFERVLERSSNRHASLRIFFRFWQALFLATQLQALSSGSHSVWNWGLVFLPVWVYLFCSYVLAYWFRQWGEAERNKIPPEALQAAAAGDPSSLDPLTASQLNRAEAISSQGSRLCLSQFLPVYVFILLVCRLQLTSPASHYSTFIILLPIFIFLGCCCCSVFSFLCCLSNVDVSQLAEEVPGARNGADGTGSEGQSGASESGGIGELSESYKPPAPASQPNPIFSMPDAPPPTSQATESTPLFPSSSSSSTSFSSYQSTSVSPPSLSGKQTETKPEDDLD